MPTVVKRQCWHQQRPVQQVCVCVQCDPTALHHWPLLETVCPEALIYISWSPLCLYCVTHGNENKCLFFFFFHSPLVYFALPFHLYHAHTHVLMSLIHKENLYHIQFGQRDQWVFYSRNTWPHDVLSTVTLIISLCSHTTSLPLILSKTLH